VGWIGRAERNWFLDELDRKWFRRIDFRKRTANCGTRGNSVANSNSYSHGHRCTYCHCHIYSDGNAENNSVANTNCDRDSNPDANCGTHSNSNTHTDSYSETHADRDTGSNANYYPDHYSDSDTNTERDVDKLRDWGSQRGGWQESYLLGSGMVEAEFAQRRRRARQLQRLRKRDKQ